MTQKSELENISDAHRLAEQRGQIGKIVVRNAQ